ncbi:hypothetical protein ABBQ38_013368 [Trebouxia sp. C0009 RCD-2024]
MVDRGTAGKVLLSSALPSTTSTGGQGQDFRKPCSSLYHNLEPRDSHPYRGKQPRVMHRTLASDTHRDDNINAFQSM